MLDAPAWDAIAPGGPLRQWRLLEVDQAGADSLVTGRLRVDERIVHFLKGLNRLDDRLTAMLTPLPAASDDDVDRPRERVALIEATIRQLEQAVASRHRLPLIHLLGLGTEAKWLVARQIAAGNGPGRLLPRGGAPSRPGRGA